MERKTIVGSTRKRKQKVCYAHYNYSGGFFHPVIRIAGKFLKDFGFHVGDQVEVIVSEGEIKINKVPK